MTYTFDDPVLTFDHPTITFVGGVTDGVDLTIPDTTYASTISKDAEYAPTYSKVGTP